MPRQYHQSQASHACTTRRGPAVRDQAPTRSPRCASSSSCFAWAVEVDQPDRVGVGVGPVGAAPRELHAEPFGGTPGGGVVLQQEGHHRAGPARRRGRLRSPAAPSRWRNRGRAPLWRTGSRGSTTRGRSGSCSRRGRSPDRRAHPASTSSRARCARTARPPSVTIPSDSARDVCRPTGKCAPRVGIGGGSRAGRRRPPRRAGRANEPGSGGCARQSEVTSRGVGHAPHGSVVRMPDRPRNGGPEDGPDSPGSTARAASPRIRRPPARFPPAAAVRARPDETRVMRAQPPSRHQERRRRPRPRPARAPGRPRPQPPSRAAASAAGSGCATSSSSCCSGWPIW